MHLSTYSNLFELSEEYCLLMNSLTGAVDILDSTSTMKLKELLSCGLVFPEASLLKELKERGHIFDSIEEESSLARKIKNRFSPKPGESLKFIICPTYGCNLSCVYCFEPQTLRASRTALTSDQVDAIFKAIKAISAMEGAENAEIGLFGGEPLLGTNYHLLEEILNTSDRENYPIAITTNGVNIEKFHPLLSRYRERISSIQVTIDGPRHIHDSRRKFTSGRQTFSKIVKGVDLLIESEIPVVIRINVDNENLPSLSEFAKFVKAKGWSSNNGVRLTLAPVNDHIDQSRLPHFLREDEMVKKISDLLKNDPQLIETFEIRMFRILGHILGVLGINALAVQVPPSFYFCETGTNQFYVFGPDDSIYPCPESIGNEDASIGSYFPSLVISEKRFSQWRDRSLFSIPKCEKCSIGPFCGGGCAYAALVRNGSTSEPVCNSAQEIVSDFIASIRKELIVKYLLER